MEKHHLVDIEPVKLVPTWCNFRTNKEAVAKRLNHFMAIEAFMAVGLLMNSMAGTRKKLSIKRLLLNLNPDVVLIQKNLVFWRKSQGTMVGRRGLYFPSQGDMEAFGLPFLLPP
jgi:hypothetical protein